MGTMTGERLPLADRLYGWLLKVFPVEFRGDFGEAMAEDFKDERQAAYEDRGVLGVIRLWARTVADFMRRAPREQADVFSADIRFAFRLMRRYALSTAGPTSRFFSSRIQCFVGRCRFLTGSMSCGSSTRSMVLRSHIRSFWTLRAAAEPLQALPRTNTRR